MRFSSFTASYTGCLRQRLSEPMQIRKTVLIATKTRFAVMATLYDVQRDIIQVNALSARHEPILSQNNRAWPFNRLEPESSGR